jgi:hypothetical protein
MTTKWNESALPKERQFLAFARKSGLPQRSEAVRIVAKWDSYNDAFRPVRVDGDQDPGTSIDVLYWIELPEEPHI